MAAQDPAVFIGSSSEGKTFADHLQVSLDDACEATVWDQGVFGLSESSLVALVSESQRVDFAILVLTPDDLVTKRSKKGMVARDNVLFEAGLFIGALGPERTFLVYPKDEQIKLASDLDGITAATFKSKRKDGSVQAAMNPVAIRVRNAMDKLGPRRNQVPELPAMRVSRGTVAEEREELNRELDAITVAAEAQGWTVKTRSDTAFRLLNQDRQRYSLAIGDPAITRNALRRFAQDLSAEGLRVSRLLLLPVGASPPEPRRPVKEGRSDSSNRQKESRKNHTCHF